MYVAVPPLFRATHGKEKHYLYTDEDKNEFFKKTGDVAWNVQRFKGLGEMNAEELWETTMNPQTRLLKRITVEDAELADQTFIMLMGEEVPPRKKFIITHAKMAELDV